MKNALRKFFTNDTVFLVVTLIAAICFAGTMVLGLTSKAAFTPKDFDIIVFGVLAAAVVVLYISYLRHDKNVMKGMIGLVLGVILTYDSLAFSEAIGSQFGIPAVYTLTVGADVWLIVNHFLINSDHHSSPNHVLLNQILMLLRTIFVIADAVQTAKTAFSIEVLRVPAISIILSGVAFVAVNFVIVCIESRLDAYRLRREENGWTPDQSR